jgi:hypothetical protein
MKSGYILKGDDAVTVNSKREVVNFLNRELPEDLPQLFVA